MASRLPNKKTKENVLYRLEFPKDLLETVEVVFGKKPLDAFGTYGIQENEGYDHVGKGIPYFFSCDESLLNKYNGIKKLYIRYYNLIVQKEKEEFILFSLDIINREVGHIQGIPFSRLIEALEQAHKFDKLVTRNGQLVEV